ncbi:FMN-linked oxidoreductase [Rhizoclosmatium globosum]|uniref:tRNA-dihydrouridine synthase n=1 Tax=Rhizoclosmatium globosum TaxID=329046 RepID=A0A1Y2CV51_9FUNG|nr:FMN-linked oxidoreductase [Rhizoclosmatium globosum]|eukprot:ORY50892.1 FMN-linked oxidoreductase [Rhizoclosmatium globosum]
MILSDVFKNSEFSRTSEFRTNPLDNPVVVQFAANNPTDIADAVGLVAPYCSGINLNCGCPQRWAIGEGIGCALMEQPDLVAEMIKAAQWKIKETGQKLADGVTPPTFSIKIRVHDDIRKTIDYVKKAEAAGVDYITVHGRTRSQRSTVKVDTEKIRIVKEHASVPIFANGDIFSLEDADQMVKETGVDGVMAARGLLENPALFAGFKTTPIHAVEAYTRIALGYGTNYFILHHHLMMMLEKSQSKMEKKHFNVLPSSAALLEYLESNYGIEFSSRPDWPWKPQSNDEFRVGL